MAKQQQGKNCCQYCLMASQTLFPLFLILVSLFISTLAVEAYADDWVLTPKVTAGFMHYQYETGAERRVSEIKDSVKLSETLPFLGVGASLMSKSYGLSLAGYYQQTLTAEDIPDAGTFSVGTSSDINTVFYNRNTELERQDYNITVGYKVNKNLLFFAGYQHGKTSYNWVDKEQDQLGGNVGTAFKENNFIADGFFLGTAYRSKPIWGGKFGVKIAVAMLDVDGEIETHRSHKPGGSKEVTLVAREREEKVLLDTVGFNVGVNCIAPIPIARNFYYDISLQGYQYKYDAKKGIFRDSLFSNNRAHEILNLDAFDIKETVYSITLSFILSF